MNTAGPGVFWDKAPVIQGQFGGAVQELQGDEARVRLGLTGYAKVTAVVANLKVTAVVANLI